MQYNTSVKKLPHRLAHKSLLPLLVTTLPTWAGPKDFAPEGDLFSDPSASPRLQLKPQNPQKPDRNKDRNFKFSWDNDFLTAKGRDGFYTNGMRFDVEMDRDFLRLSRVLEKLDGDDHDIYLVIGQNIYTPSDKDIEEFMANDRPYAGYLYAGLKADVRYDRMVERLQEKRPYRLDSFEIDVGVMGPAALGEQVQNGVHQLVGSDDAMGWKHQIDNEPTLTLSYAQTRRAWSDHKRFDLLVKGQVLTGTIQTFAQAGAEFKINLFGGINDADFGFAAPLTPSEERGFKGFIKGLRADVFVGANARYMLNNAFVEGSNFRDNDTDVDMNNVITEYRAGVVLGHRNNWDLSYTYMIRSAEFDGQEDDQKFAALIFRKRY